jgi:hypothetical protein
MGFKFEFLDSCRMVMLHGANPPPVSAWRDYLQQIRDKDVTTLGLLVFTSGGAPDAAQRNELNQVLGGRHFARAIVHRSPAVRGVVAAVGWFAPGVRAFRPRAWPSAALHARSECWDLGNVAESVRRVHASMSERISWLEGALESLDPRVLRDGVPASSRRGHAASGQQSLVRAYPDVRPSGVPRAG